MANDLPQRKHPVHVVPVERHNESVILFVTFCVKGRKSSLANAELHRAFCEACLDADAWNVGKYLIMPDHVHLFASPAVVPRIAISQWVSFLKRRISIRLGKHEWAWLPDCWDTQLRGGAHYHERWEYVRMNPERAGLVSEPEAWPWQGELVTLHW